MSLMQRFFGLFSSLFVPIPSCMQAALVAGSGAMMMEPEPLSEGDRRSETEAYMRVLVSERLSVRLIKIVEELKDAQQSEAVSRFAAQTHRTFSGDAGGSRSNNDWPLCICLFVS